AWSPDSKMIVAAAANDFNQFWNADTGEELHPKSPHYAEGRLNAGEHVAFSPRRSILTGENGSWDMDSGAAPVPGLPVSGGSIPRQIVFSPNGKILLTGSGRGADDI